MTKRLIDVDDEVVEEARSVLGTATLKDTVNRALQETIHADRRRRITHEDIQRFVEATEDLRNPEIMAKCQCLYRG